MGDGCNVAPLKCYIVFKILTNAIYISKYSNDNNKREIKDTEDEVRSLIASYDQDDKEKLDLEEFSGFMEEALGFKGLDKYENTRFALQMKLLFNGIDINGIHYLDYNQVYECFSKWEENDEIWISKAIFRGADVNKSRKAPLTELGNASFKIGWLPYYADEFVSRSQYEFGGLKELEYRHYYQILTGETIKKNSIEADPYDGKHPVESKCCLLI